MDSSKDAADRLWIRKLDSNGNTVDQELADAARSVWDRTRRIVIRYLGDDDEAATILEDAVDAASRTSSATGIPIRHPSKYLLAAVARDTIRKWKRRSPINYMPMADLERLATATPADIEDTTDAERILELIRASLDGKGLQMLELRIQECDWKQIAKAVGYASAHSAEVQFNKKVASALRRINIHFPNSNTRRARGATA